ncbi:SIMPL domain-containing protein [Segetibacter koreensis]|uniref:SIMPL domain-containing protein n=1 Tax=Segetibacter koreensis TaxID=398037 RepID=UPI00035CAB74|nr:SIMPL domain-containing protein [Segetibacter koreensis]
MKIVTASLIFGLAFIIAVWIASTAVKYRSKSSETIVVTGLAEKDFVSDLIVWNGSYSRKSLDLKTAYAALKQDENAIRKYLTGKGISDKEMVFSSVEINKEFNPKIVANGRHLGQEFTGYNLIQVVKVESGNVDKIEKISREVTELIESGIEFNSSPPAYYYSKLSDVKIDLLGKASSDARARAETIAKNAGSKLASLRKANMGVFQITGKNSNENYSYGGAFNTSQKNKTGSITIKMEFATE